MKNSPKLTFWVLPFLLLSFAFGQDYYDIEPGEGDHAYSLFFDDPPECLAVSPDGNTLIFGMKSDIFLANFSTGVQKKYINYRSILKKQESEANIGFVRGLATFGGGSKVGVAGLGGLFLMDVNSEKILWTAPGHPSDPSDPLQPLDPSQPSEPSLPSEPLLQPC